MPRRVLGESPSYFLLNDCQPLPSQPTTPGWESEPTVWNLPAVMPPTARSLTARFARLSMIWKTPLCGASRSRTSSTISPVFHSPQDQPGFRSKVIVQISGEFTPILNKALVHQRNLPMFVMSIAILTVLPLLKTEFLWLNAVNHLF